MEYYTVIKNHAFKSCFKVMRKCSQWDLRWKQIECKAVYPVWNICLSMYLSICIIYQSFIYNTNDHYFLYTCLYFPKFTKNVKQYSFLYLEKFHLCMFPCLFLWWKGEGGKHGVCNPNSEVRLKTALHLRLSGAVSLLLEEKVSKEKGKRGAGTFQKDSVSSDGKQMRRSAGTDPRWHCRCWPGKGKRAWRGPVRMLLSGGASLLCGSAFNIWPSCPRVWLPLGWPECNWHFRDVIILAFPECHPSLFLLLIWALHSSKTGPDLISSMCPASMCSSFSACLQHSVPYLHPLCTAFNYWLISGRYIWHTSSTTC